MDPRGAGQDARTERVPPHEVHLTTSLRDLCQIVAYADPASGKHHHELKRTRARSAIVVVGQDALSRVFCLSAWADRASTDRFMDTILQTFRAFGPRQFGIEANGMQSIFGDAVERWCREQEVHVPFVPVHQPTNVKKEWRIRTILQPVLGQGRLFLADNQIELLAELRGFPNYPTVDLVDALASAVHMLPPTPSVRMLEDDHRALAEYLRNSGASPSVIQQRIDDLRRESGL